MATAVMNAPFLAPRPADWQYSQHQHQHQHQQQNHYLSPMPSNLNEPGKENHPGAPSSVPASALKQLQQATPTARPRRERPCDGCRRRKSKCVLQESRRCVLCEFHKQDCTFVENAQPRKRKVPDDVAAEQQRLAKKVSTTAPVTGANQQQQKSLNADVVRTDSHAASSPRRRLSSASQQYIAHSSNHNTTATTTADLSSPIISSTNMQPVPSMPQIPFAVDESLSLQPHRHCKYLGHTTALDATLMSLNPFNARHETTSRLGQIRRVTATEFFSTHDDSSVRIPADEARALAEIARIIAPPFSISSNHDREYEHNHDYIYDQQHDYRTSDLERNPEHEHLICAALISLYFRNVHPSYPIIQKRTFLDRLRRGDGAFNPPLLAAMYLLALPWWYSDPTLARYPKPDEAALERVAMGSLTVAMERPKISALQAGLLLLQRGCNVSNSSSNSTEHNSRDGGSGNNGANVTGRPTGGTASPWTLTVQLVALGQEIGLHLDCSDWAIPLWERRLRKRLAWALYVQDKWAALVHGRPSHVHAADWAVLPLVEEDFDERTLEVDGGVGASYGGAGDGDGDGGVAGADASSPTLFPALSSRHGSPRAVDNDMQGSNDNSNTNNPENTQSNDAAVHNDFPSDDDPKIEADNDDDGDEDEMDLDLLSRGRDLFTNLITLTSIMADVVTAFYSQSALAEFRRVGWPRATQLVLLRAKPVQIRLKEWFARLPAEFKVDTAGGGGGGGTGGNMAGGVEVAAGALQLAYFATEITIHRRIVQSLAPPPEFEGRGPAGRIVPSAGLGASASGGTAGSAATETAQMVVPDGESAMDDHMSLSASGPSSPHSGRPMVASASNGSHPSSPAAAQHQNHENQHHQQSHNQQQQQHQQQQSSASNTPLPHPDPNLLSICRSAAKHRLISAMDFTNRLTPAHLSSFWYFGSAANLALIGSFGALLQATSPGAEEAGFYAARLREFRWTLGVSVPRAEWVRGAVGLVEGVGGMLGALGERAWFGAGGSGSGSGVPGESLGVGGMIGLGGGGAAAGSVGSVGVAGNGVTGGGFEHQHQYQ